MQVGHSTRLKPPLKLRYDAHQKHELHSRKSIFFVILGAVFSLLALVAFGEGKITVAKDIKH
ncbi:MAG: hypothetical protein DLM72_13425 [Candidatus Nitrosopolaris wilkensis]|nr:MAG: hypothetical protein DLM72_13425 [Candidatus Nitrosopolaris wilkensis]